MTDFISVVYSDLLLGKYDDDDDDKKVDDSSGGKKMLKYESRGDVSREIRASGDCLEKDK